MRSVAPSRHQSRRLDLHQHDAVYRTAASLFGHVGNKHEREDLNPVGRLWRPPALPGARTCIGCRPRLPDGTSPTDKSRSRPAGQWSRPAGGTYSRSVTFQYASLMNFDQLSIRTLWSA